MNGKEFLPVIRAEEREIFLKLNGDSIESSHFSFRRNFPFSISFALRHFPTTFSPKLPIFRTFVDRKIPPIGNWRPPYLISIAFPVTFLMTRPHDVSFFFFFFLVTEKHNGINIVLV